MLRRADLLSALLVALRVEVLRPLLVALLLLLVELVVPFVLVHGLTSSASEGRRGSCRRQRRATPRSSGCRPMARRACGPRVEPRARLPFPSARRKRRALRA